MCDLKFADGSLFVSIPSDSVPDNFAILMLLPNFGWNVDSLEVTADFDLLVKFKRKVK